MNKKWRRFEVLIPRQFNDGTAVPQELIGEAAFEIAIHFGASSFEKQIIEGHWHHGESMYRDKLARIFVDVPDTAKNRQWMRQFKARWKARLKQVELWMVSYRIEIE